MKRQFSSPKYIFLFGFVLLALDGLIMNAIGWEAKHEYSQTGDYNPVSIPGTYSGERYLYASAPSNGRILGKIEQDGNLRAIVDVQSWGVKSMCDTGWVQVGGGAAQFDTWATVSSGTAICICWDQNSPYMQQALCPQQPGQ